MRHILTLDGVTKRFGSNTALHPTSFSVEKGEFLALMGPSGCGKSTTLRMLAGLEFPSDGAIRLWDREITDLPPWERDMPMVWQSYALFPFMTVAENVEFGLKQKGRATAPDRRRKAGEWMERLGISDFAKRKVDQLSGGQRQRVALARALALEPEILLLDEPLSALDAHLRLHMQSELKRLHRELGITFIYVTHSQSEAFALADRVAIMSEGRVQQIGAARDVYRAPANRFVAEFVGANTIIAGQVAPDGRIDTALGPFRATDGQQAAPGDKAVFLVPADRVTLSATPTGAENEVAATLLTEEFTGSFVTLLLELADGTGMKVQKQQSELDRLSLDVGTTIHASWPAEVAYVLKEDQ
ncbi:ABC transporter ATP-binding protein [Marinibacterium sp. SX1]|uniref:ABC transporter ATP-binding protein n=1 Tax=Marinibacterium sp. SX1 TaxID=3388424 RepID=UPI003D16D705